MWRFRFAAITFTCDGCRNGATRCAGTDFSTSTGSSSSPTSSTRWPSRTERSEREREREKKTRVKIEMIWPLISFCLFFCLFVCVFISLFVLLEPLLKAKPQIISDLIVDQVFYYWTTCWGTFFDQGPMLIAALFNQTIKNGFRGRIYSFEHCAVPRISQDLCS